MKIKSKNFIEKRKIENEVKTKNKGKRKATNPVSTDLSSLSYKRNFFKRTLLSILTVPFSLKLFFHLLSAAYTIGI